MDKREIEIIREAYQYVDSSEARAVLNLIAENESLSFLSETKEKIILNQDKNIAELTDKCKRLKEELKNNLT